MSERLLAILITVVAVPAFAQDPAVQRELILRQQQSDSFVQQLQQSQQVLKIPSGDVERRRELESRQFGERQRLEQTNERQLREIRPDLPQELRPYERQKAEEERRPLIAPLQ